MKCLRLSESLGHGKMIVLFVRLAVFFKWPAPAASLVSCSTGVKPLRSLRGSRGVTTGIIISQAPLGVVKSTTARSEGRTAMRKLAMFKFLIASFYIRQIDGRGPEDMRRGPTFASLRVSRLSRDRIIGSGSDSGISKKAAKWCSPLHGRHYFYLDRTER
jgi:hypothetical protein